jgi:hypothetical protein
MFDPECHTDRRSQQLTYWDHINFTGGQYRLQFCTLLQVPTRLYGDSRNLNSFTASLHYSKL